MLQNNTFSPFRKLELSCLHALSFISLVALILFITTTNVYSAPITWVWNQNTEPDLAGYKIYIGPSSGNYDNVNDVGNQTSYTYQNLVEGQTYYVAVTAYDTANNESGYSSEVAYTVPTLPVNNPPVLSPVGNKSVNEGQALSFTISAIDPDGDTLSYTTNNLPSGAIFNESTKTFSWTPTYSQAGTYSNITFQVSDGSLSDSQVVTITVVDKDKGSLEISNLTVVSGETYEIVENGLQNEALVYIDRSYTYTSIPSSLQGSTYIKTANDDKSSSGDSFLTFNVNQDVIVYVAHDNRITTKPSWLESFTDTGDDVVISGQTHSIWKKDFPAGTITLGGNEGSGESMYTVIITGQGISSNPDTTPPAIPTGVRRIP